MSNDDPTKKVADDAPAPTTKPTIETVLERINQLGDQLRAEIARSHTELELHMSGLVRQLEIHLETQKAELMHEIKSVERKIDVINKELLTIKSEHIRLEERIDDLEKKPV